MRKLLAVTAVAIAAGCQSVDTTQPGVVGVDRDQRMMVSQQDMEQGAAKA